MKAKKIWFNEYINLELDDGRIGRLPLAEFPRLKHATEDQRENYTLSPYGIHWESLDEDLSYDGFFAYGEQYPNSVSKVLFIF